MNKCKQCNKETKNEKFCDRKCASRYKSLHYPKAGVKKDLAIFMKITGGQLPNGILSMLANKHGLTRERVRQIANKEGYIKYRVLIKTIPKICIYCGHKMPKRGKFCSPNCRANFYLYKYWDIFICKECGLGQLRRKSDQVKHTFCGKVCQGRWLAKTYGWGTKGNPNRLKRPKDGKGLLKTVGKYFKIVDLVNRFGYSYSGASNTIQQMLIEKLIERVDRGVYRVK